MLSIKIEPQTGPQRDFNACQADIAVYGGAAGGGKSFGLLLDPLRHYKNSKFGGVIFRKTSVQVRNEGGLWDESMLLYPLLGAKPREATLQWRFPSRMSLGFSHLEYDKDVLNWQGAQIPWIGFDELTHFSETQFFYMLSRNRSTSGVKPRIRATCNPDPDSWVRKFIDWWIGEDGFPIRERSGKLRWFIRMNDSMIWADTCEQIFEMYGRGPEIQPKSVTFISAKLEDNKIFMEKDPAYLGNLLAMNRVDRLRLREGNWNVRATAGMIFQRQWFPVVDAIPSGWIRMVRYWDRACLVQGTMITTNKGKRPIEEIKIGDQVLTRDGFKPVTWSGISKHTGELISVFFSNGKVLTGTRDHPVYTFNRGWVCLGDLQATNRVYSLEAESMASTGKSATSTATNGVNKIRDTSTDLSIEMSGRASLEIYPLASISTIKTATGLTTQSKIWSASLEKSTPQDTDIISPSKLRLQIQNIERNHCRLFERESKKEKATSASGAKSTFDPEALKQSTAHLNAGVPVYDLSVEDCPEFFANDILVHNSTKPNETNKDPDWTRGLKLYKYGDGSFVVVDLKSTRDTPGQVESLVKTTASHDSASCMVVGEQDPGSAGVADALNFVRMLAGYHVKTRSNSKDKVTRAKPVSAQAEVGNIKVLRAAWNDEFFRELENFPEGSHDDIVDVLSGAFNELAGGLSLCDVL